MNQEKVLITEDRAAMSHYHDNAYLGFMSCIPDTIMPRFLYRKLFVPEVATDSRGNALHAPLPLRAVEAILLDGGFTRNQVSVIRSDFLEKRVNDQTRIVALSSHDPLGLGPATTTWATIFHGVPHNRIEFLLQMARIKRLKSKYNFKVILGGTGAWQLLPNSIFKRYGIDYLFIGEGEYVIPDFFKSVIDGSYGGDEVVKGEIVRAEDMVTVKGPTNWDMVEVSRGCGRGCLYCAPNVSGKLRNIPLEIILENARMNLEAPWNKVGRIILHSEDFLRYGSDSKDFRVNSDAIYSLFDALFDQGANLIQITHASLANFVADREFIDEFTEYLHRHNILIYGCQPGLETGSARLMGSMMRGKMKPFTPSEWPAVVQDAFSTMSRNHWYPVSTLIMGLPGECKEDIIETYRLMERLEQHHALFIPLFFVPMTSTKLSERQRFISRNMTKEHWILFEKCWSHNFKHIYDLFSLIDIKSPSTLKAFLKFCVFTLQRFMRIRRNIVMNRCDNAPTLKDLDYADPLQLAPKEQARFSVNE